MRVLALCSLGLILICPSVLTHAQERSDGKIESKTKIEFEFHGNEIIGSKDLQRALLALLSDLKELGVDDSSAEDAAYILTRFYRGQGFPRATVTSTYTKGSGSGYVMRFAIAEGPRTYLNSLELSGITQFKIATLGDCFPWPLEGAVGQIFGVGRQVFSRDALEDGLSCVEAMYRYQGYFYVEVSAKTDGENRVVRDRPDAAGSRLVDVLVEVKEGVRLHLGHVEIVGSVAYSEKELLDALDLEAKTVYTPRLPSILKGKILSKYLQEGFRNSMITIEREMRAAAATVDLRFTITEGIVSTIREVRIVDDEPEKISVGEGPGEPRSKKRPERITQDRVILRYLKLRPGDLYNEKRLRDSYRSLIRSGLFRSVTLDLNEDPDKPGDLTLDVKVDERPRWTISTLVGYGSWEKLRGAVAIEHRNIFGSSHRLRAELRGSFKGERASLEYLNPFFFRENLSQDAKSFIERRVQRSFESQDYGGQAGFGLRLSRNLVTRAFYRAQNSEVIKSDPNLPPEFTRDVFIGSLSWVNDFDVRDNYISPTRGFRLRFGIEYGDDILGSELNFVRSNVGVSVVIPVIADWTLALGTRVGVIGRLPGTDVIPIQERYFAGGDDTVRSFTEDEAGPLSNGTPVGGESVIVANMEVRIPLSFLPSFLADFETVAFVDAGQVNVRLEDFGKDRWFLGVGTGIRYNTPVGPLRVDFAFNPDRRAGEDSFVVHFALGYPF